MKTIDKDYPIPEFHSVKWMKYPWEKMEIGDSFLFDPENSKPNSSSANRTYYPKRFIVRHTPEGFRCWRVK